MKFEIKNDIEYRAMELDRAGMDEEKRLIPASLSSETPVQRSFGSEVLLHTEAAIDMSRASNGLPLLFSHDTDQPIGRIEGMKVSDGKMRGMLRFGNSARATEVWEDVKAGILVDTSIGYRIEDYTEDDDGITATRWLPYEGSIVSVPADNNVGINRSLETAQEETTMDKETESTTEVTTDDSVVVNIVDANKRTMERGQQEGMKLERKRVADISAIFAFHEGEEVRALERSCIDGGVTLDASQRHLLKMLAGKSEPVAIDQGFIQTEDAPTYARSHVSVGTTQSEKIITGMTDALMVRAGFGTDEQKAGMGQNHFVGLTLSEMATEWLRNKNVNMAGMDKSRICGAVFKRDFTETSFDMTVADFPALLADVANKSLLRGYSEAAEVWRSFCSTGSVTDFKTNSRPNMSMFPDLATVAENGAFPVRQVSDWAESITATTKGARFSITRQALINDDLSSFTKIPMLMGRSAARAIGDDAMNILLTLQTMGEDANPLFDAANHNNVEAAAAPAVDTVDAMRIAMGTQTDPSGATLNLRPAVMVVPLAYEGTASTLRNAQFDPDTAEGSGNTGGNRPNWVAGTFEVVPDARIDASANPLNWFMLASPSQFDGIEVAFLNGVETPFLEQREGFEIDGTEYKVRLDYGVAALDWRTLIMNGTAPI